jgi:hypothetical protein
MNEQFWWCPKLEEVFRSKRRCQPTLAQTQMNMLGNQETKDQGHQLHLWMGKYLIIMLSVVAC